MTLNADLFLIYTSTPLIKIAILLSLSTWDVSYKAAVATDYAKLRLTIDETERQDMAKLDVNVLGMIGTSFKTNLGE